MKSDDEKILNNGEVEGGDKDKFGTLVPIYILRQYLQAYRPAKGDEEHIIYKSTQDIQDELSDMIFLDLIDIASYLTVSGYKCSLDKGLHPRWMMILNEL